MKMSEENYEYLSTAIDSLEAFFDTPPANDIARDLLRIDYTLMKKALEERNSDTDNLHKLVLSRIKNEEVGEKLYSLLLDIPKDILETVVEMRIPNVEKVNDDEIFPLAAELEKTMIENLDVNKETGLEEFEDSKDFDIYKDDIAIELLPRIRHHYGAAKLIKILKGRPVLDTSLRDFLERFEEGADEKIYKRNGGVKSINTMRGLWKYLSDLDKLVAFVLNLS